MMTALPMVFVNISQKESVMPREIHTHHFGTIQLSVALLHVQKQAVVA
jgi:hypothetical protein